MFRRLFAAVAVLSVVCAIPAAAAPPCTVEQGQQDIDGGRYEAAVREFSCVIAAAPTEVEGYRGRIEAQLLLGRYSDAVRDYARVTAFVQPVHPDASSIIFAGYADRLADDPQNVPALTGVSFANWWYFAYATAIQQLNDLLAVRPDDVYANLFRGSSRMLGGSNHIDGAQDLEHAIALDPGNPHVRAIVADAYVYGWPDADRAIAEATLALQWGVNYPRVQAILAAAHNMLGHVATAASHTNQHITQVTAQTVATPALAAGGTLDVELVPFRTFEVPMTVTSGEAVAIRTWNNQAFFDTILVVLAPDGTPVLGADDLRQYLAGFDWVAPASGTYTMRVTSFEGVLTGALRITRR